LSSLHPKQEKEMTKLFHIKIQVKMIKVDALFDFASQAKLITEDMVSSGYKFITILAHTH